MESKALALAETPYAHALETLFNYFLNHATTFEGCQNSGCKFFCAMKSGIQSTLLCVMKSGVLRAAKRSERLIYRKNLA